MPSKPMTTGIQFCYSPQPLVRHSTEFCSQYRERLI